MYEFALEVPQFTADYKMNLRHKFLFDFLLETSLRHSDSVGVPNEKMFEEGYTWMLYRMKYVVNRMPKTREKIRIRTWVTKWDKIKCSREISVFDEEGNEIVKATTIWFIFDVEKKRISKFPKFLTDAFGMEGKPNFTEFENFEKDVFDTDGKKIFVYKSDIDYNKHVNSAVYINWIKDSVELPDELLKSVEIYYANQVVYGEDVEIRNKICDEKIYHQIIANGKPSIFALTEWEK